MLLCVYATLQTSTTTLVFLMDSLLTPVVNLHFTSENLSHLFLQQSPLQIENSNQYIPQIG